MDAGRVIGLLLACLGSLFLLIAILMNYLALTIGDPRTTIYFAVDMIAWAGSFTMKGRRIGGFLVFVVGLIIIIFCVLFTTDPIGYAILAPYSLFSSFFTIPYVTIEALLMIGGGLIVIVHGTE